MSKLKVKKQVMRVVVVIFVYLFVCSDDNVKANGGPYSESSFFFLFLKDEHYLHFIHEDHRPGVPWSP